MQERIEKAFETPQGCDLVVENVRGEITVEGWDHPKTEVIAVQRKGEAEIEITQDGRKVIARTKYEDNGSGWLNWLTKGSSPTVDYMVRVPVASAVKLKNVNGPISVSQVRGQVRINNVDGTASLNAVSGEIQAETVNGTLTTVDLEGSAKLSAVNGKLEVTNGTLNGLHANTVNGAIKVSAALAAEGEYTFHTVNGSCHLSVPPDFQARVSAHGVNMSVDCQVPTQSVKRSFGNWKGTIGPGDGPVAEVRFNTVNGRLSIHGGDQVAEAATETHPTGATEFIAKVEVEPAPPEPPAPPPPPPPAKPIEVKVAKEPPAEETKSQAEILQMIERGEISVEKALKLLRGE